MNKNTALFVIGAALLGFIGGFLLANSINTSEFNTRNNRAAELLPANSQATNQPTLSDEEIRGKIAEADRNPSDFAFQKDLGIGLYRYGSMKQDVGLLNDSIRILERAKALSGNDFDVLVAVGNAYFDVAYSKKDRAGFERARDNYSKALELEPRDPDVQTDLGLTYFLQAPPDYQKASSILQKVSSSNPKHARSLQFLVQVYVKKGDVAAAEAALAKLKSIDPGNPEIKELSAQLGSESTQGK